jgi:hypothetical protein
MNAQHHVRFRDNRPPHEIQFGFEREWMSLLTSDFVDGRLEYRAQIFRTGAHYSLRLVFESALRNIQVYSLYLEAAVDGAAIKDPSAALKTSAGWFDFWTRGLVPAPAAGEQDVLPERYRSLCDAALNAEAHLTDVAAVQREILVAMRAGAILSTVNKEGGTCVSWQRDYFVASDYGESNERVEFTDEAAFLAMLRKRFDGETLRHTYPLRAPELVVWKLILRLLRRDTDSMSRAAVAPATIRHISLRQLMIPTIIFLVLAVIGLGVAKSMAVRTIGTPFGTSTRTANAIATLIRSQEPYIPSLHRNPDRDRFRIDLRLTPIMGDKVSNMINLARDLDRSAFHPGTKILGIDGPLLWMLVPELKAVDLRSDRVITIADLRAANPDVGEIWETAKFYIAVHLQVMSHDGQRVYTLDPDTLRTHREDSAPPITWQNPEPKVDAWLCLGGKISETEWLFALTPTEREKSFRPGSLLSTNQSPQKTREPRSLYRVQVEPLGTHLRFVSLTALSDITFVNGALVRSARDSRLLMLTNPSGALFIYQTGSILHATWRIARLDTEVHDVWTRETGLREIGQIMPDPGNLVLIGKLPAPQGKVPEAVTVIIDVATGAITTRSLRP